MDIKEIHEAISKAAQPRKSNIERNGYYRDPTLSANLRRVGTRSNALTDNVRHRDSDYNQVCALCFRHYLIIEGSNNDSKATYYIRSQAEDLKHKAWAILIIHHERDLSGTEGVKHIQVWENGRKLLYDLKDVPWENIYIAFERLQLQHENSRDCAKRAWFGQEGSQR
jgi:hypothetical protein